MAFVDLKSGALFPLPLRSWSRAWALPGAGSASCPVAATRNPGPSPGWRPGRPGAVPVGTLTLAALLAWTPCGGTDIVDETRARATHEVPGLKQVGEAINRVQTEVERGAKAITGKARGGTTTPPPAAVGRATASGAGAAGGPVKSIAPTQPTADRDPASVNKGPAGKEDARRAKTKGRPEKSPPGAALPAKPPEKGAKAAEKKTRVSGGPASAAPAAPQDGRSPPTDAPPVTPTTGGPVAAPTAAGVAAAATAVASEPAQPTSSPVQTGDAAPLVAPAAATEPTPAADPVPTKAPAEAAAPPAPGASDAPLEPAAEASSARPRVSGPDPAPTLLPEPVPEARPSHEPRPLPEPRAPAAQAPTSAPAPPPPRPLTGLVFRDCDDCPEYVPILGADGEPGGAPGGNRPGLSPSAFGMTRYEITFAQYDRFCKDKALPCPGDQGWGRRERPAINVAYDDAAMYADWLSKKTGRRYRLPTEAEWELAARAGTKTRYWWGDDMDPGRANCAGCGGTWDGRQTVPVGSFGANPWGLYDTAGNVWEWTSSTPFAGSNPLPLRVVRGGAWSRDGSAAAVGHRVFNSRGLRSPNLGFRLVREGPPPGGLRVIASTAARIFVDERPQGEAGPDRPLVLSNLAPGEHRIEAVASGFSPAVASHRVIPNAVTEVSMALESNEEVAWRGCAAATTMAPCQAYVSAYPEGGHVAAAKEAMERLAWETCAKATVLKPCQAYLKDYPRGRHAKEAAERVQEAGWQVCATAISAEPCTTYLKEHPKGAHAQDAEEKVVEFQWQACLSSVTVEPCRAYLKAYPRGGHAKEAAKKIESAEEAEFQAAAKADTADAWLAFIKSATSAARIKEAKGRLKALKASPAIEFPKEVQRGQRAGKSDWRWTVTFREKSGKVGYRVSGAGQVRDKQGSEWGPSGGPIWRGDVEVPAGGSGSDDFWLSGDKFCGGHAEFTWSGKDASGHSIALKERVLLRCSR